MEPSKTSVIVIGAGVVGCATANALAVAGCEVIVLEKGPRIAEGTTSRNSGVVHAGIYYPPGSLKAQSCVRGNALLYEWCRKYKVPHKKLGKYIVAQKGEEEELEELFNNAQACGARGIQRVPSTALNEKIPGVQAHAALYSVETGIVDPTEYTRSFQVMAEKRGAQFIMNASVLSIKQIGSGGWEVQTSRGSLDAEWIVNAAGLFADDVARLAGAGEHKIHPWRGDYFKVKTPLQLAHLIYPVKKKNAAGLGVHLTIALDGTFKLGPDVEPWHSKTDYAPPANLSEKKEVFFQSARKYLPGLRLEDLSYDTCGIRPKLRAPDDKIEKDFVLEQGQPGFINLVGIESPGLTAAIDLAQRVAKSLS